MDDVQMLNILRGKRIKLTLKTSSFLGVLQRINPNKTLVLEDVVSGSDGRKIPGSKVFFGREILNVEFVNEANGDSGNNEDARLEEHLNVEKFQPYRKLLQGGEDEDEYINFVVIDEFHEKFVPAVMHIKKQHVIGVAADGVEVLQRSRLSWLQISTKNKVYLFDILLLGARAFKNGLSMILENKQMLKVMHDCRAVAGYVMAHFGVKLTNVFDTQVADVMCFYSETGGFLPDRVSTLEEVVSLHLKVPSSQLSSLRVKSELTREAKEMWYQRPCPAALLKVMALSVIHLQPLRLVLLDTLMTDYMALVDSYINNSHYEPDTLETVTTDSELELPTELRQLERSHRERREWAAHRYPATESGLLARFKPRTQPPPGASAAAAAQGHSHTSPGPSAAEAPSPTPPAAAPELRRHAPADGPPSAGGGGGDGDAGAPMGRMGRGRPFGIEQASAPALPALGRGFLLQMAVPQAPRGSGGGGGSPGRSRTLAGVSGTAANGRP